MRNEKTFVYLCQQTNKKTLIMTFEIQIDQQATDQAVKLLSERGFSFMCGTAEHNDDTVIYLYGLIGDVYAAEKLLKL